MPAASCVPRSTTAFCSMANPKRVQALLALADEDLGAARILIGFSMRTARYHVQQSAEKLVKALLEHRGINPGREHRFELLAEMLPEGDPWRSRIQSLDELSPAATTHRYPTSEGRILPPPSRELVEREIAMVAQLVVDIKAAVDPSTARRS
jgi:HEPN domain-containing protein